MKRLFGTDGIRGIANQDPMTPLLGLKLGVAVGKKFAKSKGNVFVARDTRLSGPMLEASLTSGILSSGASARCLGVVPTAALAYFTAQEGGACGVMVSASHNPWNHNGFKVFSGSGEKLDPGEEEALEALIHDPGILAAADAIDPGTLQYDQNAPQKYVSFLMGCLPPGMNFKGFKVVVDCANGAASQVAPLLFHRLGTRLSVLSATPNGRNINDGCGSEHTDALSDTIRKQGADLGLAFDGDADRLTAVDEKGRRVSGDQLLAIFARMLKEEGKLGAPVVVSTVMSNLGLRKALQGMGISHVPVAVGDRNVYLEMKKRGALLGGEDSGHIIFRQHHTTGDGILSGLMLLRALLYFDRPLSELASIMIPFPQVLINVAVREKREISSIEPLQEVIRRVEASLGEEGRVLVRYSGTESVCRIMVEGEERERVEEYAQEIAQVVRKSIGL